MASRPSFQEIIAAENWDAAVQDNFDKITAAPFPMHRVDEYADLSSLNATLYEDCYVLVGIGDESVLFKSNGTVWLPASHCIFSQIYTHDNTTSGCSNASAIII